MPITIQPGLVYLTRGDWGARTDIPRLGHSVNRLDRTEAIMHHTVVIDDDATPNRWETLAEVKAKMRQLQTIRPNLGLDVPYNFVAFHMIDGSLIICEGRGLDLTGAHTHGHNTRGIATAGQGNFQRGQAVDAYADHWSDWWGHLKYNEGMENLGSVRPTSGPNAGAIAFGHRDIIATACPGDNLYAIIPQLTFTAAPEEEEDMLYAVRGSGTTAYITDYVHKWPLTDWVYLEELWALGIVKQEHPRRISDGLLNSLGNAGAEGGGVGLGFERTVEAGQEAARRGTGVQG